MYAFYVGAVYDANGGSLPWTNTQLYWPAIGPFLLSLLFIGSTQLTETITSEKYPAYKRYQQRVSKWIPFVPNSSISLDDD